MCIAYTTSALVVEKQKRTGAHWRMSCLDAEIDDWDVGHLHPRPLDEALYGFFGRECPFGQECPPVFLELETDELLVTLGDQDAIGPSTRRGQGDLSPVVGDDDVSGCLLITVADLHHDPHIGVHTRITRIDVLNDRSAVSSYRRVRPFHRLTTRIVHIDVGISVSGVPLDPHECIEI